MSFLKFNPLQWSRFFQTLFFGYVIQITLGVIAVVVIALHLEWDVILGSYKITVLRMLLTTFSTLIVVAKLVWMNLLWETRKTTSKKTLIWVFLILTALDQIGSISQVILHVPIGVLAFIIVFSIGWKLQKHQVLKTSG
jgi:hypothetical protein